MSNRETVIRISTDSVIVESQNEQGVRSSKHTNLESIQNILSADQRFETPLLPGQWGVQKYIRKDNEELFVLSVPPTIRDVEYDFRNNDVDEERRFRIPTPGTLWLFHVSYNPANESRVLRNTMAYALANPIMSENDRVYKMPFSNVGSYVCWGSSSDAPVITNSKAIQSFPTQFFLRPFNNDLGDNRFRAFQDDREGREDIRLFRVQHLFDWLAHKLSTAEAAGETFEFPQNLMHRHESFRTVVRDFFHV